MSERWLPIAGYDGLFEVSDHGRVRSYRKLRGYGAISAAPRILRGNIKLNLRTKRITRRVVNLDGALLGVHRLVLAAFVGPCPEGMEGCHNDGNPLNNRLDNLRWDTPKANAQDAVRHGSWDWRIGEACPSARLTADDVRCIRAEPRFHGVNTMLGAAFGITPNHVKRIRAGESWAHLEQHL